MGTQINTYTAPADGKTYLYYSAEKWVKVYVALETAGPVDVGTMAALSPVGSGRGVTLAADGEPLEFPLEPGDRLYFASDSLNRVKIIIYQLPWLEQLALQSKSSLETAQEFYSSLKGMFGAVLRRGGGSGGSSGGSEKKEAPICPPKLKVPYFPR